MRREPRTRVRELGPLDFAVFNIDGLENSLVESTTYLGIRFEICSMAAPCKTDGGGEHPLPGVEVGFGRCQLCFRLLLGLRNPVLISLE